MTHTFSVFPLEEGFLSLKHDTTNIIIMSSNYFVNVSKLLERWKKDFTEWMHLEDAKKIIRTLEYVTLNTGPMYLEESYGACNSSIIIEIAANDANGRRDNIAGFYVHRSLLPYVLSCISPSFAIKVSSIVDYYINKKIEIKLKVSESINRRLIDANSDKHTKEITELKASYDSTISELKNSIISIKEYNNRVTDRIQDLEAMIMEQKEDDIKPQLIILQHKENESIFKSLLVDAGECVIEKLHNIRKEYKLFFRAYGKSIIPNFESLKKRLLRDKYICLQKSGYRLIDKSRYYVRDMAKDLYDLRTD